MKMNLKIILLLSLLLSVVCLTIDAQPDDRRPQISGQLVDADLKEPVVQATIQLFTEHGVLNLVAQAEQIGHMSQTLSNSVLDNYHHLGDAASITDGLRRKWRVRYPMDDF